MPSNQQSTAYRETTVLTLAALALSFFYNLNTITPLNGVPCRIDNDFSMMLWNIWHVTESAWHLENPFLTTDIFYPVGANLSIHPLASGFLPLSGAIKLLTGSASLYPLYAYKAAVLLSFAFLQIFSYQFFRQLGYSSTESFFPAFCIAFCNFTLHHVWHLNIISVFFLPLIAYLIIKLYNMPSIKLCYTLAACLGISVYFTEFSFFIYLSTMAFGLLYLLIPTTRQSLFQILQHTPKKHIFLSILIFVGIISPFAYFFLQAKALLPNPADAYTYSANLAGFFVPDPTWDSVYDSPLIRHLNTHISKGMSGQEIFIGLPFLVVSGLGCIALRKKAHSWPMAIVITFFFLLSLGPQLLFFDKSYDIRMPFSFLIPLPIFGQFRTPVRLIFFAIFFSGVYAAEGVRFITHVLSQRHQVLGLASFTVLMALSISEARSPLSAQTPFHPPVSALSKIKKGSVAILPISLENDYLSMSYQIFHQQPIASGYLARRNKEEMEQRGTLKKLNPKQVYSPNYAMEVDTFAQITSTLGITNVILTSSQYPADLIRKLQDVINIVYAPQTGPPLTEH